MAEFRMPALGADMEAGTLVAWRKKPGERLVRGDIIAEVETDKGVIEVEVFVDGVLDRYLVEAGHRVPVGTPLAIVSESTPLTAAGASEAPDAAASAGKAAVEVAPSPLTAASAGKASEAARTAGGASSPLTAASAGKASEAEAARTAGGPSSPLTAASAGKASEAAAPRSVSEASSPLTAASASKASDARQPMAAAAVALRAAGGAVPASSLPPPAVAAPPSVRRRARELGVDLRDALLQAQRVGMAEVVHAAGAGATPKSSPAARRRAQELNVDLRRIHGTGPDGAIVLADVEAAATAAPALQPAAAEPVDPKRALRRAIAAAMARSKREVPHYYLSTTIDLARTQAWLNRYNLERSVSERIVAGALLLKASALAAKQLPDFNCLWQDADARRMPEVHLGVAIALRGGGLVAPAIHRADTLSLPELMRALQDLVARARAGTLRSSELSDGTITVTSLGERGVDEVLPIIYPPQTAIVGFGRIAERPWVVDSALAVRPLVTASLGADHRVTDGHLGARFLNVIEELLQHPEQL